MYWGGDDFGVPDHFINFYHIIITRYICFVIIQQADSYVLCTSVNKYYISL